MSKVSVEDALGAMVDVRLRGQFRFYNVQALRNANVHLSAAGGTVGVFASGFSSVGLLYSVRWDGEALAKTVDDLVLVFSKVALHALSGRLVCRRSDMVAEVVLEADGATQQFAQDVVAQPVATDNVERVAYALKGELNHTLRGITHRGEVLGQLLLEAYQRGLVEARELVPYLSTLAMSQVGIPSEVVLEVLNAVDSEEVEEALVLVEALASRPDRDAEALFGKLLGDSRGAVRGAAIRGVLLMGEGEMRGILEAALKDRSARRRRAAVDALAELPGGQWVDAQLSKRVALEKHDGVLGRLNNIRRKKAR